MIQSGKKAVPMKLKSFKEAWLLFDQSVNQIFSMRQGTNPHKKARKY